MKTSLIALGCAIFLLACKKETNKEPVSTKQFTFVSLVADAYEIKQGNVTRITANVNGEVTYHWTCSSGDLFGSGNSILFGAGSCCTGDHQVNCEVKDKNNNKETKSVNVFVK
jgi:hypothetical protein